MRCTMVATRRDPAADRGQSACPLCGGRRGILLHDRRTGEILDVQRPEQPAQTPDTPATPGKPDDSAAPAGSEISISEALSRVLQELGISLPDIRDVNAQRVQVSGRDAYHITFTANGKPYSFYVDTHDGDLF